MDYRKLHCILFTGVLSLALAFNATAESRRQHKARELELRGDYLGAIELYKQDMTKQGKNAISLEGVAKCYFALGNFEQAESSYVALLDKEKKPAYNYAYAEVLLRNGKYKDATWVAKEAMTDSTLAKQAERIIAACDSAAVWEQLSSPYAVHNLDEVNTCYAEWGAQLYSPTKMLFSSDRPMEKPNCNKGRERGVSIADGYISNGVENDSVVIMAWSAAKMLPYPFNDKSIQVAPIAIVPNDTTTLYYTRTGKSGVTKKKKVGRETIREFTENLEIYSAKLGSKGWEYVSPFEYNDSKRYSVMHPCISPDGKFLYFASDMPGGLGGTDIWVCEKQSNGSWGRPTNLGAPVNTPGNEVFPTMSADGTLYFSSNGHKGMGGLDIFYSKKARGKWQPVRNMKTPFNSSADDFFFIKANDSTGYFSSNRLGGKGGDDIYMFTPLVPKSKRAPAVDTTPVAVDTTPIAIDTTPVKVATEPEPLPVIVEPVVTVVAEYISLNGKLTDKQTKLPLSGVKICATQDATKTSECKECENDGAFVFELKNNERYTISAFKEGYQSTAPIRLLATKTMEEEEMPIEMTPKAKAEFQSAEAMIDRTAAPQKRALPREYRVQVLANWQETDWAYFDRLRHTYPQFELQYTKRDRATRFTYGSFTNLQEARKYLRLFMNLGYEDSFIAVFEYGKQVESIFSGGSKERVPQSKPRR